MTDVRPFPPSPRRRALARQAGLHAASPLLAGGLACGAAVLAIALFGRAVAAKLGAWIAAAVSSPSSPSGDAVLVPSNMVTEVLELAAPLALVALVAVAAHLAQTRTLWMPRRRLAGAPALPRRRGVLDLVAVAIIGTVAFAWLWLVAPQLAALPSSLFAAAALVASALATFAIAWVVVGVADALLRHRALDEALHMTAREKREDDRLAGADPRWRRYRGSLRDRPVVEGATVLLLGDGVAVAVAWDPILRPIPTRTAAGEAARATQLLGLARRHDVRVHRDHALAAALAGDTGPIPERYWPRLAEIVAAVRR